MLNSRNKNLRNDKKRVSSIFTFKLTLSDIYKPSRNRGSVKKFIKNSDYPRL